MVEVREQAVEGGEVELSCLVPRSRPAAVLRWYRDRKELKGTRGAGLGTGTLLAQERGEVSGGRGLDDSALTLPPRSSAVESGVMDSTRLSSQHLGHPQLPSEFKVNLDPVSKQTKRNKQNLDQNPKWLRDRGMAK